MKLLQISDIHIDLEGRNPSGVDVRRNFQRCLTEGLSRGGDWIIVSGDMCVETADDRIYAWIKATLDATARPWRVIPGNHDSSAMVARSFSIEEQFRSAEQEVYWREASEHHSFYFLDSAKGDLSAPQLSWLKANLEQEQKPPLIFMHHPPVHLSVPLMDRGNFPAPDGPRFLDALRVCRLKVNVFVGHYHVDKVAVVDEAIIWACPSSFYQMGQLKNEFEVDHYRPGYRLIELSPGRVLCSCHYLSADRASPAGSRL